LLHNIIIDTTIKEIAMTTLYDIKKHVATLQEIVSKCDGETADISAALSDAMSAVNFEIRMIDENPPETYGGCNCSDGRCVC
jgi:hypothetical protein